MQAHVCPTCGLPDMSAEADKREGRVLCQTCGRPLNNTVLADSLTERGVSRPPILQEGSEPEKSRKAREQHSGGLRRTG